MNTETLTRSSDIIRHAGAPVAFEALRAISAMKLDLVVDSRNVFSDEGRIVIADQLPESAEAALRALAGGGDNAGTGAIAGFTPSFSAIGDMANKLDIPVKYLRRIQDQMPRLFDQTVTDHMRNVRKLYTFRTYLKRGGGSTEIESMSPDEARAIDSRNGQLRAVLSDRYQVIDNLDVFTMVLDVLAQIGVGPHDLQVDLSDHNFYMKFRCPEIDVQVPELLRHYRGKYGTGSNDPRMFAGLIIQNSETGHGSLSITPRIQVLVCRNGMTRTEDIVRQRHLGGKLEAGQIDWSTETQRANLQLALSQLNDAVKTYCTNDYLVRAAREMVEAGTPVVDMPIQTIERASETIGLTKAEQDGVMNAFMKGRDGGSVIRFDVVQAFTAHAQDLSSDRQADLEGSANDLLFNRDFWQN